MKESNDILSLFEALNSHEVFTPPRVARQMLDLLPAEIWHDPSIKILDPCVKSGVFLRECLFKLFDGLKGKGLYSSADGKVYDLDVGQQRINHIFKNMLFGIATSELTGYVSRRTLYGVMKADSDKQISALDAFEKSSNFHKWSDEEKSNFVGRNKFNEFFDHNLFRSADYAGFESEGNIFYPANEVKKIVSEEDDYEIEDKYFPFIEENTKHQKILDIRNGKMKFDVIIGNPPYQVQTGGHGSQAKPVYHKFIEMGKKLRPRFIVMITPSRWFSGGMGLGHFREEMITEKRISKIFDFHDSTDCFPGVEIKGGVSYFLWDHSHKGLCEVFSIIDGVRYEPELRDLNEFDIFIRHNKAISILKKVLSSSEKFVSEHVSGLMPFGLPTNFNDFLHNKKLNDSIICYARGREELIAKEKINSGIEMIDKYKVLMSKAYNGGDLYPHQIVGKPFVAYPGSCCTMTYIVCGSFETEEEAKGLESYLKTKFARFLIFLRKSTQDVNKEKFGFLPIQDFSKKWEDKELYKNYELDEGEIKFIESTIRTME